MYLSKVMVPWNSVKNPYQLHKALWKLFPNRPDDERNFLFRVESVQRGSGATVLMQSAWQPEDSDSTRLLASKKIQLNLSEGMWLRFRLRANPIKTIKDERKRTNRKGEIKRCRVPLINEEEQIAWLQRKLATSVDFDSIQVSKEAPIFFHKKENKAMDTVEHAGKVQPICFEGVLKVKDSEELLKALLIGIGPAKSLGCGMLSVAPA